MKKNKDNKMKVKLTPAGVTWEIIQGILYGFMFLIACTFIVMFAWIIMNAFKTAPEYMADTFALPKVFDWENFKDAILKLEYKGYGIFGMLGNSLIICGWNIISNLTFPHMAAYVMARFDNKFNRTLETIIWITMVIPVVGSTSSELLFLTRTGLYDTFAGICFFKTASLGFGSVMLTNFFRGVSRNYAEAAYMDGASEWQVFTKIYYPQAKAITFITVLRAFIATWNEFMEPYLYLPSHPTLALGLQQMQKQFVDFGNDYPVMFAGVILAMIPIVILYLRFSDTIINNMSVGSMK